MKLKSLGLYVITMFVIAQGYAQVNDFNLSDYKLPELKRKTLETEINLAGVNNNLNASERFRKNFNGDISIDYTSYLNTEKKQKNLAMGLDFHTEFNKNISNSTDANYMDNKRRKIRPFIYMNAINRNYDTDGIFHETNIHFQYLHYNIKEDYWDQTWFTDGTIGDVEYMNKYNSHDLTAYFPLKIGKGRIEQVQDARHAVYLFDELFKQNRISQDKSPEEIIAFAELISSLKNQRFFDSRIRRIHELEAIDSFLVANEYVLNGDIRYFTTLSDYWAFGNRPIRESGKRFSASITPGYTYKRSTELENPQSTEDIGSSLSAFIISGGIDWEKERPINLRWQNSWHFQASGGMLKGTIVNDPGTYSYDSKMVVPSIHIGFTQTIAYYPNTRTNVMFTYAANLVELIDKTDFENDQLGVGGGGGQAAINLSANYYISPKFRLNVSASLKNIWQYSENEVIINFEDPFGSDFLQNDEKYFYVPEFYEQEFTQSFSVRLVYSIF